ncbi:T6SS effector BTH_I2691 family protein [Burkholderia sp. LMU1-1-1.1]|uniref:T6SS effector BTH_I2691 family protein n=1 Tax=Burkholderia sp. LMU1-1-1.1 TaxID=3135266 RepID=UPI00344523D6
MTQTGCPYCDRKGLFIYPVRYAIACPAGAAGVPGLSGNFKIEDGPANIGEVKYALRAVRPGYLYTYDEKRGILKGYLVMPKGNLWSFSIDQSAPTEAPRHMNCTDSIDVTMSYCVDILHSEKNPAGTLWIGWSNSGWTPNLIKMARQSSSWRSKHMQRIDVAAMIDGYAAHTGEFSSANVNVAHFSTDVRSMQRAFGFSNTAITHETRQGRSAEKITTGLRHRSYKQKGYIVAVDDPVGIANDFSELTVPSDSNGFDEKIYRAKIIDDLLRQTESSIRARAKHEYAEENAALSYTKTTAYKSSHRSFGEKMGDMLIGGEQYEKERKLHMKRYEETRGQMEKLAADKAWNELTTIDGAPLLDDEQRRRLPQLYENSIKAFEPRALILAEAHVNWLSSLQLANWMEGNHDAEDLASGFAFRESLAQCIGKGVGTTACQTLLSQWLNSPNTADRRNLYLRALMFNHEKIAEASQAMIGGGDIKLENVFSIYQGAMARLQGGHAAKLLDHLVLTTANILVKALTKSGKSVSKNVTTISLSLLGRVKVEAFNLSVYDARNWLVEQAKASGVQLSTGSSQTKSDALKAAKKVVPFANHDPGICAYQMDLAQLERDGRITPGTLKAIRIPGFDLTRKWLSSSELNIASVAIVLQTVALFFAVSEYKDSDRFESSTTGYTAAIASMSLSAAIVEATASVLDTSPGHPLSAYLSGHWGVTTSTAKKVILVAKKVALVAGVLAAVLDFYSAYTAWQKGEQTLGILYALSGVAGATLTYAAFFVGAIFFWPAFVGAAVIAIILSIHKQGMLKKWISHCFFARGTSGGQSASIYYHSLDEELQAYGNAIGGT